MRGAHFAYPFFTFIHNDHISLSDVSMSEIAIQADFNGYTLFIGVL